MNLVCVGMANNFNRLDIANKFSALKGDACTRGANPNDVNSVLTVNLNVARRRRS